MELTRERFDEMIQKFRNGDEPPLWDTIIALRQRIEELEKQCIELDNYEVLNLEAALQASMEVDGDHPLSVFNSGDWIGQIRWKLEEWRKRNPDGWPSSANRTPEQYKAEAIERSKNALEHQLTEAREQVRRLEKYIESGFMAGAYARLKHLQNCERERDTLRGALEKIAKPALGGKQQQWIAQQALKDAAQQAGEERA